MKPLLLVLPGNEGFAQALVARAPMDVSLVAWRHFPDGESLLRVDVDCSDREVVILASLIDPDRLALPLRFVAGTARELGARRVGLVAPYLGYMRQDKRFNPGEVISSVHFAKFLDESVDWLITVDPHLHRHPSLETLFTIPACAVTAMPAVAQWIAAQVERPVLIGPDAESAQWVRQVATLANVPAVVLEKQRHGDRDVEVSIPEQASVVGRTPVLVDDIVSSGRTLIETRGHLRRLNLPPAVCVVVHGIFADGTQSALLDAGAARVVTVNTLPHATNAIDASEAVVQALQTLGVATPFEASP